MDPKKYPVKDFLWSQTDGRWSWKKVGISKRSVREIGCALLCQDYVFNRYTKGHPLFRPGQYVDLVNANAKKANYGDWLTPSGETYWNNLDRISGGRIKHTYDSTKAHFVLACVIWGGLTHWVVKLGDGSICYNPYGGKIELFNQPLKWRTALRKDGKTPLEIYYAI